MEERKMKKLKNLRLLLYLFLIGAGLLALQSCVTTNIYRTPPVTVSDIKQMSKDGVPAKTIISKMRKSRTVYRLKADQLAELQNEGVASDVINYMEQTHLNAIRHNQQLEDLGYWWPGWDGYYYGGPAFGWPYNYWNFNWGPGIIMEGYGHGRHHEGEEHEGHEKR